MTDMKDFICNMPKAELHLHVTGTLEADFKFELAKRHGIELPFNTVEEIQESYNYPNLESFLDGLFEGNSLLRSEEDMYDLTYRFLRKTASEHKVLFTNLMFNPQEHLKQGISLEQQILGMHWAQKQAEAEFGICSQQIVAFVRPVDSDASLQLFEQTLEFREYFAGVGFDWAEKGNPPLKFKKIIERAKEEGLKVTCHCDFDQENTLEHIRQCLVDLDLDRIDHGVNMVDDPELMALAAKKGTHFTICPISTEDGKSTTHPRKKNPRYHKEILQLIDAGVDFSLNTDDPAYFMGYYMNDLMYSTQVAAGLSKEQLFNIMTNTFNAAWIPQAQKDRYLAQLRDYYEANAN